MMTEAIETFPRKGFFSVTGPLEEGGGSKREYKAGPIAGSL